MRTTAENPALILTCSVPLCFLFPCIPWLPSSGTKRYSGREGRMSHPSPTQAAALPQAAPVPQAGASSSFAGYTTRTFRGTATGRFLTRVFRVCASLQLAIVLLSLFASCLALATFLESAYSGRIAQDLVYHTWWFALLLVFLAVNILCAALKKYPWKRHQIGFLITHA